MKLRTVAVLCTVAFLCQCFRAEGSRSKWIQPRRPVVVIPGMAGTQLKDRNKVTGEITQAWAVISGQETIWKKYVWGRYNAEKKLIESYDPDHEIFVEWEKDFGLFGSRHIFDISSGFFSASQTEYLNPIFSYLESKGYKAGEHLWGCPYDWRYPLSHPPHVERLKGIIMKAYEKTGARVDLISHSSGCYLPMAMFAHFPEFVEKYVHSFITCGCPFKGTPARVFEAFVEGYTFEHPFLSVDAGQAIANEAGMLYEVLGVDSGDWGEMPVPTATWTLNGKEEVHDLTKESFPLLKEILSKNSVEYKGKVYPLPHNQDLVDIAQRENPLRRTSVNPPFFYNMYSTRVQTPYKLKYKDPISDLTELAHVRGKLLQGDGDGTILTPSARDDWYQAVARMRFQGLDHMDLIKAPKAQEALGQFFDVECPWEGLWTFSDSNLRGANEHSIQFYVVHVGTLTTKLNDAESNGVKSLQGTIVGRSLRGKIQLDGHEEVEISFTQDEFCSSFSGKMGTQKVKGNREIGEQCQVGEKRECSVPHGMGFKHCVFGRISQRCEIHECDDGYALRGFPDKPESCIKNPRLSKGTGKVEGNANKKPTKARDSSHVQFDEKELHSDQEYIEPQWRKEMRMMWYYTYAVIFGLCLCCIAFPGRWFYNYMTASPQYPRAKFLQNRGR